MILSGKNLPLFSSVLCNLGHQFFFIKRIPLFEREGGIQIECVCMCVCVVLRGGVRAVRAYIHYTCVYCVSPSNNANRQQTNLWFESERESF